MGSISRLLMSAGVFMAVAAGQSQTATFVWGQNGSFTSSSSGTSATKLNSPTGVAVDGSGGIYVADWGNNRVLHFSAGNATADRVYGQGGSFTSGGTNPAATNANTLAAPGAIIVDAAGGLYVADTNNNRVLHFPSGSTTADRVYGQGGSFTSQTANTGGISANSLSSPIGLVLDSAGGLYVGDYGNARILYFPSGSTTANQVYGQSGSFTTNSLGVSATAIHGIEGLAVDASGGLLASDSFDQRLLHFPSGSTTADRVYGQGGSFNTSSSNNGGVSANSLSFPSLLVVDPGPAGGFYVADGFNNRVLHFTGTSTTADTVWGQGGSFAANAADNGGVSASSLNLPVGVAVDSNHNMWVADRTNNRVLYFPSSAATPPGTPAPPTVLLALLGLASAGLFLAGSRRLSGRGSPTRSLL